MRSLNLRSSWLPFRRARRLEFPEQLEGRSLLAAGDATFRLEIADDNGVPIVGHVALGSIIHLRGFVQDTRPAPLGIFSTYVDILFNTDQVPGSPTFSRPPWSRTNSGATESGVVRYIGADTNSTRRVDATPPLEALLFDLPFTMFASGETRFTAQLPTGPNANLFRTYFAGGDDFVSPFGSAIEMGTDDFVFIDAAVTGAIIGGQESPPMITSDGGGDTARISVAEFLTAVTNVTATDPDQPAPNLTFSIIDNGDDDRQFFTIDAVSGALRFPSPPDSAFPRDGGRDNTYTLTVAVFDGYLFDRQTITVEVLNINDPPGFQHLGDVTVNEDSDAYRGTWAVGIAPGPPNELSQRLEFQVVLVRPEDAAKFTVLPTISPEGLLSFTLAPNANGTVELEVTLEDSGGTANGGRDRSPAVRFRINIVPVNDPPEIGELPDVVVDASPDARRIPLPAVVSAGPADEAGQRLIWRVVGNSNPRLFTRQPEIDADGNLTLTAGVSGTATIEVVLEDDGGRRNGGVDTSLVRRFTITIRAVPVFPLAPQTLPISTPKAAGPALAPARSGLSIYLPPVAERGALFPGTNFIVYRDSEPLEAPLIGGPSVNLPPVWMLPKQLQPGAVLLFASDGEPPRLLTIDYDDPPPKDQGLGTFPPVTEPLPQPGPAPPPEREPPPASVINWSIAASLSFTSLVASGAWVAYRRWRRKVAELRSPALPGPIPQES